MAGDLGSLDALRPFLHYTTRIAEPTLENAGPLLAHSFVAIGVWLRLVCAQPVDPLSD